MSTSQGFNNVDPDFSAKAEQLRMQSRETVSVLKAVANEKRLLIVYALLDKEQSVGDLESYVGISQSALSQHLAKLRIAHIVQTRRDAQTIYYSINKPALRSVMSLLYNMSA